MTALEEIVAELRGKLRGQALEKIAPLLALAVEAGMLESGYRRDDCGCWIPPGYADPAEGITPERLEELTRRCAEAPRD